MQLEAFKSFIASSGSSFRTANELVTGLLRRAIIEGVLKGGMALHQDELASVFGVSRIPVREALIQLDGEGFVQFVPRKGASVTILSAEEMREISEMRAVLEPLALRLSLARLAGAQLDECGRILDEMDSERSLGSLCRLHQQFHLGLYSACGRKRLLAIIESFGNRMDRYLRFIVGPLSYRSKGQSEHRDLLRLCVLRNTPEACALLERHILAGAERFVNFLEKEQQ